MPEIIHDGIRLFFLDLGDGPPLLLLHPFPLSSEAFRPQVGGVPARLILPDCRGFGHSEGSGPSAVRMEDYAADALAILDALGIERAIVGGVSMGGYVAMAMLRLAPQRAAGLALMDTQVGPDDADAAWKREVLARSVLDEGLDALIPGLVPRLVAQGSPLKGSIESMIRLAASREGVAAALRGMALRPDSSAELAAFKGPSLVVVGEDDAITGPDKAAVMAALLSGSSVVRAPGAGHLANMEAPEVVNRALSELVERARV